MCKFWSCGRGFRCFAQIRRYLGASVKYFRKRRRLERALRPAERTIRGDNVPA
jgi:hypothetical protein